MKKRLLWQIFPSYLVITLLALIAFAINVSFLIDSLFISQTRQTLEVRAQLAREVMETSIDAMNLAHIDAACKKLGQETKTRITVIESSGRVLGESDRDPQTMESHLMRPEVQQALKEQVGFNVRPSATLEQRMMYVAVPVLRNNQVVAVVRTSIPLIEIQHTLSALTHSVVRYGIIIVLVLAVVSLWYSWELSRPLVLLQKGAQEFAKGRLTHKLDASGKGEIAELAKTMNMMAEELDRRIQSTVRQQNQQQAMFTAMLEGVIAFDISGKCLTLNKAAAKMLGLDASKSVGRTAGELIRNSELQLFIQNALQSIQPTEQFILMSEPGGQESNIQASASPLLDNLSDNMGSLIVLNDMTRIYRLEQVRRDFVANVSHELKTPITSIHGFIETLLDGAVDNPENVKRFLNIVARQTDRLNSIIEDLLLLCELEQQDETVRVPRQVCIIRDILNSAVELCRHKADERTIQLDVECPPDLKSNVNASLLEQAVLNLADNAVKYSNPGGKVIISAGTEQNNLVIRVQDFGCGIASEHQSRIFERFYRVDKARSRQMGGTGLGLAIVKHIAQYHQGTIRVESAIGKGSTFILSLPMSL
ncbi:MAG: HAMP domain-containing protein [Planctomycetes bacterium]|nr:HAMP domain-containing protein [Planctomycetota bacterium]